MRNLAEALQQLADRLDILAALGGEEHDVADHAESLSRNGRAAGSGACPKGPAAAQHALTAH